jgi:lysophospholipase L1-like esterase
VSAASRQLGRWGVRCLSAGAFSLLVVLPVVNLFTIATGAYSPLSGGDVLWSPTMHRALLQRGGVFRFNPRWLWEPSPGAEIFGDRLNPQSCRGPELTVERNGKFRVLVLGDSQSFGHGLADSESWPRLLASSRTSDGREIEVLNASCPGHTIVLGMARYLEDLVRYQPDVVVLSYGTLNEAAWPASGKSDIALCLATGQRIAGLQRILDRVTILRRTRAFLGDGPLDPRSEDIAPFRVSPAEMARVLDSALNAIQTFTRSVPLVVLPLRAETLAGEENALAQYGAVMRTVAGSFGVQCVDLAAPFAATGTDASTKLFRDPLHFTEAGHRLAADAISAALRGAVSAQSK